MSQSGISPKLTPTAEFINLSGVTKSYKRGTRQLVVLDSVDLLVAQGSFEAIMGPSGSGKTTLLNLIGGIDRAEAGRIQIGGIDLMGRSEDELAEWRSKQIGFVFQFYNLAQVLTAFQNVELPLLLARLSAKERHRRVETALELVGLQDRRHHFPRELSGGEEQRVGIARAIVTDPALILADEPTGDLDRESASSIMDLLSRLNRELHKTILMVTHDQQAALAAQRIRHIDKGKLIKEPRGKSSATA